MSTVDNHNERNKLNILFVSWFSRRGVLHTHMQMHAET